jgi:hypothetical protein
MSLKHGVEPLLGASISAMPPAIVLNATNNATNFRHELRITRPERIDQNHNY